ncbi:MAG: NAD+ synthase [Halomonadaceae bacterium]|nr:MAG: NAD+ synthase [Halomonadaceae bacterium]
MAGQLRVVMAQLDFLVGDIPGNGQRVIEASRRGAEEMQADLVVFPELALTGYPPEDLLLRPSLSLRLDAALAAIQAEKLPVAIVLGLPLQENGLWYNGVVVIDQGEVVYRYHKQHLPNFQVFDEVRYFSPGKQVQVFPLRGVPTAITVCEDLWNEGPAEQASALGARLLININASPYHGTKLAQRQALLARQSENNSLTIVYVNLVGGQDELVFDGASMVYDHAGVRCMQAPVFVEGLYPVDFVVDQHCQPVSQPLPQLLSPEASSYQALVLGTRDYVLKNGFNSVVLGLSGGIDSALTLAIAVDALGPEKVTAVMMPFHYTSGMSLEDAEQQARTQSVDYRVLPIAPMYDSFMATLAEPFGERPGDTTEENLQARIRGVLLMSLSNKWGALVLTTGNKSELAVGYSTLYGDMAGGFDPIKDVPKTWVYRLASWRNREQEIIPQRVIDRPPSAELAPDQKDQDSLPDYAILDAILNLYVERDYSAEAIIAEGFDRPDVARAIRLVDINEYKRRQAPIGVRISDRGFGKDRRYPITNGWKPGI